MYICAEKFLLSFSELGAFGFWGFESHCFEPSSEIGINGSLIAESLVEDRSGFVSWLAIMRARGNFLH